MPIMYSELFGLNYYQSKLGPLSAEQEIFLFIHGLGGSYKHWMGVISSLSPDTMCVALDLPGHGSSPGFAPKTIEQASSVIARFIDCVGIICPVHIVGHSVGGQIVVNYVQNNLSRVASVTLISSAALIRVHPDLWNQICSSKLDVTFWDASFSAYADKKSRNLILNDFSLIRHDRQVGEVFDLVGGSSIPCEETINKYGLIIYGTQDRIISPRRIRQLAPLFSKCKVVSLPDRAHYPHLESPEQVAFLLKEFVDGRVNNHDCVL